MNRVVLALASAAAPRGANLGCAMVAAQSAYGGGRLCEMSSGCSHCTAKRRTHAVHSLFSSVRIPAAPWRSNAGTCRAAGRLRLNPQADLRAKTRRGHTSGAPEEKMGHLHSPWAHTWRPQRAKHRGCRLARHSAVSRSTQPR